MKFFKLYRNDLHEKLLCLLKNSTEVSSVQESSYCKLGVFTLDCVLACHGNVNWEGKCLESLWTLFSMWWPNKSSAPLETQHSGREPCEDAWKQSSSQFLGCWFFLSSLLTSPIHNIFTGYFFKICIGRELKTTKGLFIIDNGLLCSVRCLLNIWQQCVSTTELSLYFVRTWEETQREDLVAASNFTYMSHF